MSNLFFDTLTMIAIWTVGCLCGYMVGALDKDYAQKDDDDEILF
jgi:hypothetical protein